VAAAIEAARASDKPALIACKTTIGYGAPTKAGKESSHGAPLGEEEIAGARAALGWPHAPFEIPEEILRAWRAVGRRGQEAATAWYKRLDAADDATQSEFRRRLAGTLPSGLGKAIRDLKAELLQEQPKLATRKASERVLQTLTAQIPELIGGSADLSGSNNTKVESQQVVARGAYAGSYVHYGVREHAMAAAMNGMALHKGVIPYGGTFLVFSDYSRPAIRLAALSKQRVVHVMTHDSIGLGEDGPTHQPIEHLAALRAMPRLRTLRPCDPVETAECWQLALDSPDRPSVLALSRQGTPTVRAEGTEENYCAYGAYILQPAKSNRQVTLVASGTEVAVAVEARRKLAEQDISAAVVSMPCWELFLEQPAHYRDEVLGTSSLRVGIEAAGGFGWERWTTLDGVFVGMKGFGASAPGGDLYAHFKITADDVVENVKNWL
jgi:transketolase